MNKFWRGIAIFVLGGVLGTGLGVALGFFLFPYVFPPPAAASNSPQPSVPSLLLPAPSFMPTRPIQCITARDGSAFMSTPCFSSPMSRSARTGVPRLSGTQSVDPLIVRLEGRNVRRSRGLARLQRQSALFDPGRC